MCDAYGMMGSLVGNMSIVSLMFISRDRYNVIVRGVSAARLTHRKAALQILFIWTYAIFWTILPFLGWSRYVLEGNMTSCTVDYFAKDWKHGSYVLVYGTFVYFVPLSVILHSYVHIVLAVARHEKSLRVQAKKMKVSSIKANVETRKTRAEVRMAKISFYTVGLWVMAWTPYLIIAWYGRLSPTADRLTPLAGIWGAVFAKSAAVYNPLVYAISHPRYRKELIRKFPSLACAPAPDDVDLADAKSEMSVATSKLEATVPQRQETIEESKF